MSVGDIMHASDRVCDHGGWRMVLQAHRSATAASTIEGSDNMMQQLPTPWRKFQSVLTVSLCDHLSDRLKVDSVLQTTDQND